MTGKVFPWPFSADRFLLSLPVESRKIRGFHFSRADEFPTSDQCKKLDGAPFPNRYFND